MRVGVLAVLAACSFEPGGVSELDAPPPLPTPRDCLEAFERGDRTDGVFTIDPDGAGTGAAPFEAYCDMTTDGGGWTLVLSYGFVSYGQFTNSGNAITPRPSWAYTQAEPSVPVSTVPPSSPSADGAVDYAMWATLGSDFLVQTSIDHWLSCVPASGSLVMTADGTVACTIVRLVGTGCTTTTPTRIRWEPRGPLLSVTTSYFSTTFYYWEGSMSNHWPTHDPCGTNSGNQLAGVADPRGAIFLRR